MKNDYIELRIPIMKVAELSPEMRGYLDYRMREALHLGYVSEIQSVCDYADSGHYILRFYPGPNYPGNSDFLLPESVDNP